MGKLNALSRWEDHAEGIEDDNKGVVVITPDKIRMTILLEIDIVMSSLLFMLITYYSVMTDTNERDWHSLDIFLLYLLG